jgi:histidinol-phosphatase (PHP family)
MWSNFHAHSNYCDGKGDLIDHVKSANKNNVVALGFSSHAPLPFDCKWCMKNEGLSNYIEEINYLKNVSGNTSLFIGLEVDFIPDVISPKDFETELDYTIGSVHFVDQLPDGTRWEIDGSHISFLDGLSKIFHNNIRDAITRYYELTRKMITSACPTIIGHMDKIKIQNIDDKFFKESDSWYRDEIEKTISLIKKSDAIVEVNTRGIYQKKTSTTYPSPWILKLIQEHNIPVTLNSDSHHPDDLINQFSEAANMLHEIGFKKISSLKDGQWQQFKFNENGLVI